MIENTSNKNYVARPEMVVGGKGQCSLIRKIIVFQKEVAGPVVTGLTQSLKKTLEKCAPVRGCRRPSSLLAEHRPSGAGHSEQPSVVRLGQLQHSSFVWPALLCTLSLTPSVLGSAPIPHACLFWVLLVLFFPVCLICWCPFFPIPEQSHSILTKSPHYCSFISYSNY